MRRVGDGDESYDFQVVGAQFIVLGLLAACTVIAVLSASGFIH